MQLAAGENITIYKQIKYYFYLPTMLHQFSNIKDLQ